MTFSNLSRARSTPLRLASRAAALLGVLCLSSALVSSAEAAAVCERGYVTEVIESAVSTTPGPYKPFPRFLYRTDGTGFLPVADNGLKYLFEGKYYSEIEFVSYSDPEKNKASRMEYELKVQAIKNAMISKTPIRVFYFANTCGVGSTSVEVLVCTSEVACNV